MLEVREVSDIQGMEGAGCTKLAPTFHKMIFRIIEWFVLEGTSKSMQFQPSAVSRIANH